jgi:hypothetical protein
MGYTHYWYRAHGQTDPAKWSAFVADCRKVCDALLIPLGDGSGEGSPVFGPELVAFNGHVASGLMMPQAARVDGLKWPVARAEGVAGWSTDSAEAGSWFAGPMVSTRTLPDNGDGSYESFIVSRQAERCFDCCKTNFHPYDLAVQCCLVALKEHFRDAVAITSDGDADAWREAGDACQHVLGYGLAFVPDEGRKLADAIDAAWTAAEHAAKQADNVRKFGDYPPVPQDRNAIMKAIRVALQRRTGRTWSVTGGRGTAWGWLKIDAPPKRRKWLWVDNGRKGADGEVAYDYVFSPDAEYGHMSHADQETLRKALGLTAEVHHQGVSIPSGSNYWTEYFDRAEGREPRSFGKQYWD